MTTVDETEQVLKTTGGGGGGLKECAVESD